MKEKRYWYLFIKKYWLLVCIVAAAFLLRVYNVQSNPPALTWDEVSIGYNAWSILKTGRDEHNRFLPIDTFVGYGDYKPPVSVYVTVPFVALFGLNELSVRLPVVIFSVLTILLTFLLTKKLFSNYTHGKLLSYLSACILTISPWHINLSRAGFEAVIALFFVILGVYILISVKLHSKLVLVQWLPFVAAIYTFNSSRYFVPLLFPLLLWYRYSFADLKKYKNKLFLSCIVGFLFLVPIIPHLLSKEARLRFKEVNIFSDVSIVELANKRIEAGGNTFLAKIINNRRVGYALAYAKHYLDHFEPSFLFIRGDGNPKFSIQDVGQLYILEALFLVVGWYALFRTNKKTAFFLLSWLLLAIVPAGVARETPHALRILNTLPVWHITIAMGIVFIYTSLSKSVYRKIYITICIISYSIFVGYYLHNYHNNYPYEFSGEWQYGYKQAILRAESLKNNYDHIVLSDVIGRPYMYTLFYGQYLPEEFWKTKESFFDAAGFYTVKGFGKYVFVNTDIPVLSGKVLYILPPDYMKKDQKIIEQIRLLNGTEILRMFE